MFKFNSKVRLKYVAMYVYCSIPRANHGIMVHCFRSTTLKLEVTTLATRLAGGLCGRPTKLGQSSNPTRQTKHSRPRSSHPARRWIIPTDGSRRRERRRSGRDPTASVGLGAGLRTSWSAQGHSSALWWQSLEATPGPPAGPGPSDTGPRPGTGATSRRCGTTRLNGQARGPT